MNRLAPLMSSAKGDWQTPDEILKLVRYLGPIALDPCTSRDNPTDANRFYCANEVGQPAALDGLSSSWDAAPDGLIYCNPPYGRGIGVWMKRCRDANRHGEEAVALVPARTDTAWFQTFCAPPASDAVCFWRGRLTFKGAPNPAPFPSAIVYWGDQPLTFKNIFEDHGRIWI